MFSINILAVVLAAVAAFVLGFLFHGPISGKLWMKLANIHPTGNEKFTDMLPKMGWNLFVNFVTAFILAVIYMLAASSPYLATGVSGGIVIGVLAWLGFLVTSTSIAVIWMGQSFKLWLFETVCSLIVMIVMGAIIAGM
jgi:hypothetical protein